MKFDDLSTSRTYSDRAVDGSWITWCSNEIAPAGKRVADIGCGGGIYSHGFVLCGAEHVIGIDSSEQYVEEAKRAFPTIEFVTASCESTGLRDGCVDIVHERAIIHHLNLPQRLANANEMLRILAGGGMVIVQDRTLEDVLAQDDEYWIRRELISMFPRLIGFEANRRPSASHYSQILKNAGFVNVELRSYAEVRRIYASAEELDDELECRKGKSILFELSDDELAMYRRRIQEVAPKGQFPECDRWTVWKARKLTQ